MMLASTSGAAAPIPPETRRLAGILARPKTGEILANLHRHPYQTASEVARAEEVHVATAQRYLRELVDAGILGIRTRHGGPRPIDEYWLLDPRIRIDIDLESGAIEDAALRHAAGALSVRERAPANVVYDTDPRTGDVQGLLVLSEAHPRLVEERIRLPAAVGRFLTHLPYVAGDAASVWEIMQRAGLDESHLEEILSAVGRLTKPGTATHLNAAQQAAGEPVEEEAPASSARPLDPELSRLFEALGAGHTPGPAPAMALLELVPLGTPAEAGADDDTDDPGGDDEGADPERPAAETRRHALAATGGARS